MNIKEVKNKICAKNECNMHVETTLVFQLGFSAGFCISCAQDIIKQRIGIEDLNFKNGKALGPAERPFANVNKSIISGGDPKR